MYRSTVSNPVMKIFFGVVTSAIFCLASLSFAETIDVKTYEGSFKSILLKPDISTLSKSDKQILSLLIDACEKIDECYWIQTYGNKDSLLKSFQGKDPLLTKYSLINYGPWSRFDGDKPFVPGFSEKPKGANYYPIDIKKEEIEKSTDPAMKSLYTMVRRKSDGSLHAIPYNQFFKAQHDVIIPKMREAAKLSTDAGFKKYLELRANALETNNYQPSDMAWMDMKTNTLDFVAGPIENYDDQLLGMKATYEAFLLVKDLKWSAKLARYVKFLPDLQKQLPVDSQYKKEVPGLGSELNAYDVVYASGEANTAMKTIAINLPNDEEVQSKKGARRLQIKNAVRAKYDNILLPIADVIIDPAELKNIKFEAFFTNIMFHEVAHGLGVKNTITGKGTVREALKETYSTLEEGKADILGLFLVQQLMAMKEYSEAEMKDHCITLFASTFRTIRFGATSAHGKANLIRFNYFKEKNAFTLDPKTGKYTVALDAFAKATTDLSREILILQGNGDYDAAVKFIAKYTVVTDEVNDALKRIADKKIPVDIVYEQGKKVLGL